MSEPQERKDASSADPGAYFSKLQMKCYLQDLRTNRPARPTGSRPPPAHFSTWSSRSGHRLSDTPVTPLLQCTPMDPQIDSHAHPSTTNSEHNIASKQAVNISLSGTFSGRGRPLVQLRRGMDASRSSIESSRTFSVQNKEGEQRQKEKNEAHAVRIAMEELELDKETKLYEAARDEAAELVHEHRNPGAAQANPNAPYAYPELSNKGSLHRSRSVEAKEQDLQRANSKLRKRHSTGSSNSGSRSSSLQSNGPANAVKASNQHASALKVNDITPGPAALAKAVSDLPDTRRRRRSSGSRRTVSGSLFKNPSDQIYEEPEEECLPVPAPTPVAAEPPKPEKLPLGARRNPFMRFQSVRGNVMTRSNTDPLLTTKRLDRYEIQNNPPSQSRNAAYTSNTATTDPLAESKPTREGEAPMKVKDGKEIRGEDIRAATGFRLRNRSPRLPTPTAVSDAPGRPIVSFKKDWNTVELKEEKSILPAQGRQSMEQEQPAVPRLLSKSATLPIIATVKLPEDKPKQATAPPATFAKEHRPLPASTGSFLRNRLDRPSFSPYKDGPLGPHSDIESLRGTNAALESSGPSVPAIKISKSPTIHFSPPPVPSIPKISVSETPPLPLVAPLGRSHSANIPLIGISPPLPTIAIHDSPASSRGRHAQAPSISITPEIPMISVSDLSTSSRAPKINAPSVSVTTSVPTISVNGRADFGPAASTRPLPNPQHHIGKSHSYNGTASPRTHWTPTTVRTGALCNQCALPIAGRIVSAGGVRFHPECFACYQCGEHLECVAFYPEPTNKHTERIQRIRARMCGQDIAFLSTHPTEHDMARLEHEDGTDESSRFYCHLDFHELFSPRCKSCKTPIEGEVIVACGAEWHAGHFFCAQCGDPFDSTTPFVEKEGYAWCVNCHTNRFSTKCKGCRKPVTDTVVKALGAEWHANCFVCVECSGPFQDGRYFLRGTSQDPVCMGCEERRLKA